MPVEDQLSPRQWLRQAAQHEAEAEARLAEMNGQDPDSGYARYLLAAAAVRADLAKASATAARAAATQDPMDDRLVRLFDVGRDAMGAMTAWLRSRHGPLMRVAVVDPPQTERATERPGRWDPAP